MHIRVIALYDSCQHTIGSTEFHKARSLMFYHLFVVFERALWYGAISHNPLAEFVRGNFIDTPNKAPKYLKKLTRLHARRYTLYYH